MGDSITEGTLVEWSKKENDLLKEDDIVAKIETDKVTVDIRASEKGTLLKQLAKLQETVKIHQPLFIYTTDVSNASTSSTVVVPKVETPKQEVKQEKKQETPIVAVPKVETPKSEAPKVESGRERRVPMSRMRQKISQRLKESQNTFAMLTTFQEVDMSNLTELRAKYKDSFVKKHGIKLGFMSAFVKASTLALIDQPVVNAVIDGTDVLYRDYVDISVAVATPTGLVVPVLRNCQDMGFAQIEKSISDLGEKAKKSAITIQDMQGGTFTISNGGVFGSLMGTPIINPPQSAILGMHSIQKRAMVVNDKIEIRPMMYLALTYDHRLIDGREAVLFLVKVKELIENPSSMLLE